MTTDNQLTALSQRLDDRIMAAFDGNAAENAKIDVLQQTVTSEAARLRVELRLGWSYNSTVEIGQLAPPESIYYSNKSDLEACLRNDLDTLIKNPTESAALEREYENKFEGLIEFGRTQFTVRQIKQKSHCFDACRNCSGHGRISCNCLLGEEFCRYCSGKGTYSTTEVVNYVTGQQVTHQYNCTACYGKGRVACFSCNGAQYLNCRSCNAQGWFTTIYTAEITANLYKSITSIESDRAGFAKTLEALPVAKIAHQGMALQIGSKANNGSVVYDYRVVLPYIVHNYRVKADNFEVHGIGQDILVPNMPPFLDKVISPVATLVLNNRDNPDRALKAAEGCKVTNEILFAVGKQSTVDAGAIAATFHGTVSIDLVQRCAAALTTAYNTCGATVVWSIWIKCMIALNLVIGAFVALDGFRPLTKFLDVPDVIAIRYSVVVVAILTVFCVVWLCARHAALRAVRKISGARATRAPSQGWMPGALGLITAILALTLVQYDYQGSRSANLRSASRINGPMIAAQPPSRGTNFR